MKNQESTPSREKYARKMGYATWAEYKANYVPKRTVLYGMSPEEKRARKKEQTYQSWLRHKEKYLEQARERRKQNQLLGIKFTRPKKILPNRKPWEILGWTEKKYWRWFHTTIRELAR